MADKLTFGSFYFDIPAATVLSSATPAKAAGSTVALVAHGFTIATDNRITLNVGQATRFYEVTCSISSTKATGGDAQALYALYKNGVAVDGLHIGRTHANSTDEGAICVNGQIELEAEDYLELWVETDNGDDVTIQNGVMAVKVIG